MVSVGRRWPQWLPAALGVVAGSAVSTYLLFAPGTTLPDGTPASGIEAGNPFLVGLALFVSGLALVGALGAARRQPRLVLFAGISLLVLGSLPIAIGPQVWIVGLLMLLSALLGRWDAREDVPLVVVGVVLAALAGLLALTVFTASALRFVTAALAVSVFVGALLATLRALGRGPTRRLGPALVAVLVVSSGLAAAVVTEAPAPRVLEFTTTDPDCASSGASSVSAEEKPRWNRYVVTVSAGVSVPDASYELAPPELSREAPGRYVLALEHRRTDAPGKSCPARIQFTATVQLPRIRGGGYHLEVRHADEVVVETWGGGGSSGVSG